MNFRYVYYIIDLGYFCLVFISRALGFFLREAFVCDLHMGCIGGQNDSRRFLMDQFYPLRKDYFAPLEEVHILDNEHLVY